MFKDVRSRSSWSLLGACIIAVFGALVTSATLAYAQDQHDGRVSAITDAHLVLSVESVDFTFRWNEETAVMLNGESAEVSDLQSGDSARVDFQRAEDGVLLAISVDAIRR